MFSKFWQNRIIFFQFWENLANKILFFNFQDCNWQFLAKLQNLCSWAAEMNPFLQSVREMLRALVAQNPTFHQTGCGQGRGLKYVHASEYFAWICSCVRIFSVKTSELHVVNV